MGTNLLEDGKSYIFEVTFKAEDGYVFPEDFAVIINGETLTSGVTISGIGEYLSIAYPFTLGGSSTGVTVSGTATSAGGDTDDVTIQLIRSGTSETAYETIVKGKTAGYSIAGVAPGTYTMKVMKQNHITREYTVTVGAENVTQNVKIHLKGDINGDGKVTTIDFGRANSHAKGVTLLTGYELQCADTVKQDGLVTTADAARINAHAKGTSSLW
ncbi:MAG: dockerin type I domain-containing protein [Eubacteriales bacterium]